MNYFNKKNDKKTDNHTVKATSGLPEWKQASPRLTLKINVKSLSLNLISTGLKDTVGQYVIFKLGCTVDIVVAQYTLC